MSKASSRRVAVCVLLAMCGAGCGKGPSDSSGDAPLPGIVILCIDTLRADAVGIPGSPVNTMPTLEKFAREAVCFSQASSSSSWTPPAVATLLTGLLPSHHGVRGVNGEHGDVVVPPLVGGVVTLAEALRDAGWDTAAYTAGGWLSPIQGMDQGFRAFGTGFDQFGPEFAMSSWERSRPKDRPFFLYLHTLAAHDPYGDKKEYWQGTCDKRGKEMLAARPFIEAAKAHGGHLPVEMSSSLGVLFMTEPCGRRGLSDAYGTERLAPIWPAETQRAWVEGGYASGGEGPRIEERLRTSYREGLTFVDSIVARTLAGLDGLHLPKGTLVAIVGDHGESFGEHGALAHGMRLYDELVRVPMLVRAPGRLAAGHVVTSSVGLVDLMPTLLEMARVPIPPDLDGKSFLSLMRTPAPGHPVVAEVDGPPLAGSGRPSRLVSVRDDRAKWILKYDATDGSTVGEEAYDLRADPGEKSPLASPDPTPFEPAFLAAIETARKAVRAAYAAMPRTPGRGGG